MINLKRGSGWFLGFLCLVALIACQKNTGEVSASSEMNHGILHSRSCTYVTLESVNLRCYEFVADKNQRFRLPVVVLSRQHRGRPLAETKSEALVFVPGGPGQGRMTSNREIEFWVEWVVDNKIKTDLIVYDPRGVQGSNPEAACQEYNQTAETLLGKPLSIDEEQKSLNNVLLACVNRFKGKTDNGDAGLAAESRVNALASQKQAEDIVNIAKGLGYQNIHLWGTSYGTRLALLASRDPTVKSLLLDSLYPLDKGRYSEWVALYRQSFNIHAHIFSEYLTTENKGYLNTYKSAISRLAEAPVEMRVDRWGDKNSSKILFLLNENRLLELGFSVLYSPHLYKAYYDGLLTFAVDGQMNESFKWVVENFVNTVLDDAFSPLVYFAVECLDNLPESSEMIDFDIHGISAYSEYFRSGLENSVCSRLVGRSEWSVNDIQAPIKPTILISGEYDPVTPSRWAKQYAKDNPQVRHIEFKNASHAELFNLACDWSFIDSFVSSLDPNTPVNCEGKSSWQ